MEDTRVLAMINDKEGNLIVGTDKGVYRYLEYPKVLEPNIAVKGLAFYKEKIFVSASSGVTDLKISRRIWTGRTTCIFPSDNGLYIGTLNGLHELTENGIRDLGEQNKLLKSRISAITKMNNGTYWISTYGDGIIGLKNGRIIINIRNDLLTSNICRTLFASGNVLWAGTDKGLNKIVFEGNKPRVTKFTTADGLSSNIINAILIDSGFVFVGTPHGLTYFDDKKFSQNSDCILRINSVKISNNIWHHDTSGFSLSPRDNNIRFDFVGISYRSAGDITYRYRLAGLDNAWKNSQETFLSYPSLPSGSYELQLLAINKFGIRSGIRSIHFTVQQRTVEKTWFVLLIAISSLLLVFLFVNSYIKRIRNQEKEKTRTLRKMAELEQMALRSQMNPHFIFNSLNSIQHYVIDKDIAGANKFITDFSSLIRQTLEFSARQEVSLSEEITYLSTFLSLEKSRMEDKFSYEIRLGNSVNPQESVVPPMILQPFVENSIRHGIGYRKDMYGRIIISVELANEMLVCMVEDNGVGRSLAGQFKNAKGVTHRSKGTSVTMDRIEMLNRGNDKKISVEIADLIDEEGKASGTRVTVSFPFNSSENQLIT